ncbi:MAG: MarR family transcriptional regulator [Dehalococcoidia bacterium]
MLDQKYNDRLNNLVDDMMVQFPRIARKMIIATRAKKAPVSSDIQLRLLEGLIAGPMKPSEISRIHCISKPNVTTLISKLIENGLAERSHDEKDRRVIYINITEKGKKVAYRRRKIVKEYMSKIFDQLDEDEIEDTFAAVEAYRDILVRFNDIISLM